MRDEPCPTEEDLYAIVAGEGASFASHFHQCQRCQMELQKLQTESTIFRHVRDTPVSNTPPSLTLGWPGSIGKFVVVGVWSDNPNFITYRGLHSIVRREVLIQVSKTMLGDSSEFLSSFHASCGRWLQSRPSVPQVLDAGAYQSRPYLVVEYVDGVPLDRLVHDAQLDCATIIRIFGMIAKALAAEPSTPHPQLTAGSILVDASDNPTLIDWPATVELDVPENRPDSIATHKTSRRLLVLCCEAILDRKLPMESLSPGSTENDLTRDLIAHQTPPAIARFLAQGLTTNAASPPSLDAIASHLLKTHSGFSWSRLLGR